MGDENNTFMWLEEEGFIGPMDEEEDVSEEE